MSDILATLSPYDITVVITQGNVSHTVTKFAENSIVSIDQSTARFEMYTGADNSNTRIHKNNTSGTITLHLQQSSSSNDVLSALLEKDLQTRDSTGLFSFLVKDNSGRSFYYAAEAYVANIPNAVHGTTMEIRDWVIHAPNLKTHLGGNSKLAAADIAALTALGVTLDPRWTT